MQARFQYLDRLPRKQNAYATFGSCVHHALEHYNSHSNVDEAIAVFLDVWENPEKIRAAVEVWPTGINYGGARQRGLDMIRGYHEKQQWEQRDVLASEHRFLVPIGSYELSGIVDLLELKRSAKGVPTLRVVDFKTNKRYPYRDSLSVNVQWTAYLWAVAQPEFWLGNGDSHPPMDNGAYWWEMIRDVPARGIWYHLETQKELDVGARDDKDFARFYRVCQMIERAEKHNVFVPNISGESCGLCSYTAECGLTIGTIPEDEERWL